MNPSYALSDDLSLTVRGVARKIGGKLSKSSGLKSPRRLPEWTSGWGGVMLLLLRQDPCRVRAGGQVGREGQSSPPLLYTGLHPL